jgi:hypothetical protein
MRNIASLTNPEKGTVVFSWDSDGDEGVQPMMSASFFNMKGTKKMDILSVRVIDSEKSKWHIIHNTHRIVITKKDAREIWNTLVSHGWTVGEIKWRT